MMLSLLLLGAISLAMLSAPRAITGQARRQLERDLTRWAGQTGLSRSDDGLSGRWRGTLAEVSEEPPGGLLIRCATEVAVPSLEVFVNARLVPLGFTFIYPHAPGAARWALSRREHLPLLRAWLADEALFAALAGFLQGRRARIRGGWLELEHPGRPEDLTALLDEVSSLTARLSAAWWAPRQALAARWALRFARDGAGWQLHGRLRGAPVWLSFADHRTGRVSLTLPHAPPGLRVSRHGDGPADVIGNPLLDHLLAVRCPPPRTFLHDPDLSAALLAAVHGIPGTTVHSGSLIIDALPDDPAQIDEALERLSDLIGAWPEDRS